MGQCYAPLHRALILERKASMNDKPTLGPLQRQAVLGRRQQAHCADLLEAKRSPLPNHDSALPHAPFAVKAKLACQTTAGLHNSTGDLAATTARLPTLKSTPAPSNSPSPHARQ